MHEPQYVPWGVLRVGPIGHPPPQGRCNRAPLANGPRRIPLYCVCSGGAKTVTGGGGLTPEAGSPATVPHGFLWSPPPPPALSVYVPLPPAALSPPPCRPRPFPLLFSFYVVSLSGALGVGWLSVHSSITAVLRVPLGLCSSFRGGG